MPALRVCISRGSVLTNELLDLNSNCGSSAVAGRVLATPIRTDASPVSSPTMYDQLEQVFHVSG